MVKASTSDSPPDAEPASTDRGGKREGGGNAMVRFELEAAEALAGLAHLQNWNQEEQRPSRQAKTESQREDSVCESVVAQHLRENLCTITVNGVNVQQEAELHKPSPMCTTSNASFSVSGRKSRQKLTENEKEARRIRRVLANRESARQTIRRREALYEELIRKAASLARENEILKKEKDLAMEEYDSLKSTNETLKVQLSGTVKAELEEAQEDLRPTNTEMSTSCTNYPFLIYNQSPSFPFIWPAIVQSPNAVQLQGGTHNAAVVSSNVPMAATAKADLSHEQANPLHEGPQPPLFILPCPFFVPLCEHGHGLHQRPSIDMNNEQIVTATNNQSTNDASAKTIGYAEKMCLSVSRDGKLEASSSKTIPVVNHETGQPSDVIPNDGTFSSTSSHIVHTVQQKKLDLNVSPSKKQVDAAAAAAEARKRRKELTKLKSMHCRELGMSH